MNVNRVGGISSEDPSKKKDKISPDSGEFNKIMKIKQTSEVDPEEKSKRRKKNFEEAVDDKDKASKEASTQTQMPSPYNADFYKNKPTEEKTTPQRTSTEKTNNEKNANKKLQDSSKEPEEKKPSTYEKEQPTVKEEKHKTVFWQKKPPEKTKKTPEAESLRSRNRGQIMKENKHPLAEIKEKKNLNSKVQPLVKEEKTKGLHIQDKSSDKMAKNSKEKEANEATKPLKQNGTPQPIMSTTIPQPTMQAANVVSATISSYLTAQISPLFTQMVGSMVYLSQKGISYATITLNSPSLVNSAFYDCKIIIKQYSTAPNSFNITLKGNVRAVNLFEANISTLRKAFDESNLDFQIGRLEVELEENKPLIKRKQSIKDQNKGSDTKK
jgi:hypothetical protein